MTPLAKRLPRELRHNIGKYLGIFLLMCGSIALTSGFLLAAHSIGCLIDDMHEEYTIEDGRVTTSFEATDEQLKAAEDAAEDVGFMPHTVCRRQEGTPGVQTLPEDRALNSFAAGETAGTENTAAPQMEAETPHQTAFAPVEEEQRRDPLRFVGEVFDTYIVTQRGNDMCLLDKHAAHERIIYESLAASYGKVSSQMLLVPVTVQLSAEEKDALVQSEMLLQDGGLEVEDFGGNSVVVRAVPADVVPEDVEDLVVELASRLVSNPRYTTSEKTEWVLHSIACRAAIKAGDKTHAAQLLRLAEDVLDGRVPPFCPHGRPIVLKITKKELEKQFGRQG